MLTAWYVWILVLECAGHDGLDGTMEVLASL